MFKLVVKIGIIGYRNHALRLINIIEKLSEYEITHIFHPSKTLEDSRFTNNLSDMYDSDCILICSPNQTHYPYLKKLLDEFKGYIFCEKPPAITSKELNELQKLPIYEKQRIFFNFNYRFSHLADVLKNCLNSEKIGKIIHINIIASQGLAFKKEYPDSWRANGKNNLHNLLDTLSIHYLDLLNLLFGSQTTNHYFPSLVSGNGTSYDTCYLIFRYNNEITASVLNSYATPYTNQISILGSNGFVSISENNLKIFSPRDTFDSNGFFISPPLTEEKKFDFTSEYINSLTASMIFFLNHVKEKNPIDISQFNTSILTNKMILDLKNSF
jgi:predicted dehydrogenase